MPEPTTPQLAAGIEHEPGSWCWSITSSESENDQLHVYVSASGGDRSIALDDGGDPVYLDQGRVEGLVSALRLLAAIAWPAQQGDPDG